jgi:hypothetical protein
MDTNSAIIRPNPALSTLLNMKTGSAFLLARFAAGWDSRGMWKTPFGAPFHRFSRFGRL